MPLFGSNFAQGLVTGFAESASKSIDNAMAQRDADVSAAKKFAMTRAAQLEEQATAKDKRTQNAIDKMASKFTENGETDWNRVYGAIMATDGGDLDSLDALFANMQKTSANGIEFDINDVFTFAEGDETLSQLSRDDIFQALRAEYEAPTVRTTDTTFLSKIGLGAGETGGEAATEQMRGLFPGATRTAIQGDYGTATLQQDKLAAAIEYGMKVNEYKKNMIPSLAEEYATIQYQISNLDENATPEEKKTLQDRFDRISEAQANWTKLTTAETTTPGAMTAAAYSKVIENGRQSALELAGLSDKATFVTVDGETVPANDPNFAAAIQTARQKVIDDYNERQVRSQMNPDGTLSFLGAQVIGTDVAMGDIFRRISTSGEENTTTTTTTPTTEPITSATGSLDNQPNKIKPISPNASPAEVDAKLVERYPDPADFVRKFLPKKINNPQDLFNRIRQLYPAVSNEELQEILNNEISKMQNPEQVRTKPEFKYETPEQVQNRKTLEEDMEISQLAGRS